MTNHTHNKQVKLDLEVFYPSINNEKTWEKYSVTGAVMKVIALKEEGLILISKVPVKSSDFISFLIKIGEFTSFNCLLGVEEVKEKQGQFVAFCKFYLLSDSQQKSIKKFIDEN